MNNFNPLGIIYYCLLKNYHIAWLNLIIFIHSTKQFLWHVGGGNMKQIILSIFLFFSITGQAEINRPQMKSMFLDATLPYLNYAFKKSKSINRNFYKRYKYRNKTGNLGWFFGNRPFYWHYLARPNDRLDRNFAHSLYKVYEGYCKLNKKGEHCLRNDLKVYYRFNFKGRNRGIGRFYLYKKVNGRFQFKGYGVSRSMKSLQAKFFQKLNQNFTPVKNHHEIFSFLNAKGIPLHFKVARGNISNPNEKLGSGWTRRERDQFVMRTWGDYHFRKKIINQVNSEIGMHSNFYVFEGSYERFNLSDEEYNGSIWDINENYGPKLRRRNHDGITLMVLSTFQRPENTMGGAFISKMNRPYFFIKTRHISDLKTSKYYIYGASGIRRTGHDIVHELGHNNLDLGHRNQANSIDVDGRNVNTENYFRSPANIKASNMTNRFNAIPSRYEY